MKKFFIIALSLVALIVSASPDANAAGIFKIGKDVNIADGQKVDNVVAAGGQITVGGLVENNIVALGGSVVLTGDAIVRGNVYCLGGVVVQGSRSQIYGKITEVNSSNILTALSSIFYDDTDAWSWISDVIYFCFFGLLLTLALIIAFLFPRPLNAIVASIQGHKIRSFFWGFLGTMMIAPFFMLLILSFVGIPLIPLAFSVILLAFMFGFLAVSALLGKFVLMKFSRHHRPSVLRETMLGLILWWIIGWLPFYAGMMIKALVITTGFGGVLLALFYKRGLQPPSISDVRPSGENV